jgi:hypothetical protein
MRRRWSAAITAAAGAATLVVGLAALDIRVRDQVASLLSGRGPSGELVSAGSYIETLISVVATAVRDQSMERAPLVMFSLAALVLVLFMLRT